MPPGGRPLSIVMNGCTLFDGRVTSVPWYRVFSLTGCPAAALTGSTARIELRSPAGTDKEGKGERAEDGLGIATIDMLARDWPPPAESAADGRGAVRLVNDQAPLVRSDLVRFEVRNAGDTVWIDRPTAPDRAIDVTLRWRPASRRGPEAEQRLALPFALYPGDKWTTDLPLVPPTDLDDDGPWRVEVGLTGMDGTRVPTDVPLILDVQPDQPGLATRRAER
jgi:hypothetical protein